jgi:peptidoglycan/LPS O-acetylase OafA/YrhL
LKGPINLKNFYLRRFCRLMPTAWTYLIVLLLFARITGNRFITSPREVMGCLFFYRNFLGGIGLAGHFWSLSVEEQFYLVWPVIMFFAGMRRCRWIALLGALGCAVFRQVSWKHYSHTFPMGPTFLHADGLLVGCLLALLFADERIRVSLARWSRFWAFPAFITLLSCLYLQKEETLFLEQISIACLIAATTLHPTAVFARPLSFKPLAWFGTISYSVYIWHGLFMFSHSPIAVFVFMPLFALAGYYAIERPSTRIGHTLTISSSKAIPRETAAVTLS